MAYTKKFSALKKRANEDIYKDFKLKNNTLVSIAYTKKFSALRGKGYHDSASYLLIQ